MKIAIILGTRPEIIKMLPIIKECQRQHLDFFIIHSGQHYLASLDQNFFKELNLPLPQYNLSVGSGSHAEETGKILMGGEKVLVKEKPSVVLVEGDTNTVLAGALAASKLQIKVGHVEAGLRSYDREMPEEINRVLADHLGDYLFCPTKVSQANLIKEGIEKRKIFVTGNTIVDAYQEGLRKALKKTEILERLGLKQAGYFLVTIHRPENVDQKKKLMNLLEAFEKIFKGSRKMVICPLHPRTKKMLRRFKLKIPYGLKIIEPVGYFDFLNLEKNARLILTDSGGVQEEACIMKVPCVTLRENTERPETLQVGANLIAGTSVKKILASLKVMLKKRRKWPNPFGDGTAGKKIVKILIKENR